MKNRDAIVPRWECGQVQVMVVSEPVSNGVSIIAEGHIADNGSILKSQIL
jgi:hypothetical protein